MIPGDQLERNPHKEIDVFFIGKPDGGLRCLRSWKTVSQIASLHLAERIQSRVDTEFCCRAHAASRSATGRRVELAKAENYFDPSHAAERMHSLGGQTGQRAIAR